MKVSRDKYELPEAIADSARELAKIVGVRTNTVFKSALDYRNGTIKKPSYIKVVYNDED